MQLAERKRIELTHKLDSLSQELDDWLKRSKAQQPLRKHYTQICRLRTLLNGFQTQVRAEFPSEGDAIAMLKDCRRLERMILEAHRLWEFFRSKLALRQVTWFRASLIAADQFAWECYQPVRACVSVAHLPPEACKEPPLVFFNGVASPFAQPRDRAYQLADLPGESPHTPSLNDALQRLPVPIIGIPWFQAQYLPDMLIIGHEVGHCVECDFCLTARLQALLQTCNLPSDRLGAWQAWLSEVFADLYGVLASGPAFVSSLMEFLAIDPLYVARQSRSAADWTRYPTSHLRILLCLQALRQTGHAADTVETLARVWKETYVSHAMVPFEADIDRIVAALISTPYPEFSGLKLTNILAFDASRHQLAMNEAALMLAGKMQALSATDARILLPAARLAYEQDHAGYALYDAGNRALQRIEESQDEETRGARGTRGTIDEARISTEEAQRAQQNHDASTGKGLFELLW